MLLAIDAGNSNVTLAVFNHEELLAHWRLTTDRSRTADEYGIQARTLFELAHLDSKDIQAIAIASVVPPLDYTLQRMSELYFELTPMFVDHTTDTGLRILYEPAADVGADRIVDAVAAVHNYGAPCIVVDFGTATTFNAVNSKSEYLGGVITPGIMVSAEALFARTAKLPRVDISSPGKTIGTSTITAIQSGLYYGYVGLVDGILERIIAEMDRRPKVIATGGLAPVIATGSKFIEKVDETLTLLGLRLVHARVRGPLTQEPLH